MTGEGNVRATTKETTVVRAVGRALIAGALLCVLAAAGWAQATAPTARWYYEPRFEPPEHPVDMLHMRVELAFVPEEGLVRGTVTHRFTPLRPRVDSLFLNAPGITILSATYRGRPAAFATSGEGVTLRLDPPAVWDRTDSVTIRYEARPRRGLYFIGWNDTTGISRKQIWSQGQGIDNRNWIPCYDEQNDKLTTELLVTFASRYRVLSNGVLVSETHNADGTTRWHYRMNHPHAAYLVMLGIGEYGVERRRSASGVPLSLYYYPDHKDRVEPTYRYSAEAVDFLERETGVPYPWESYAQIPVQDYLYGAMENTTATVFGDFFLVDNRGYLDRNYVYVNLHELTHQWFGDYITGRAGRNAWLHESFATFYPKLFLRATTGEDAYEWARHKEQETALAASARNRYPILHSGSGAERVYQKGSAVIDMMRYAFGEEPVRRVITAYLKKHAYGLVESNDLYQAFQDVLGLSPAWFFEQWIYRGGEPHYTVNVEENTVPGLRRTVFTVRQDHQRDELVGLFRMPVVFAVHYQDGSVDTMRVMIGDETSTVIVPNPQAKPVAFTLFDPGSWILKSVTFPKPFEQLAAQAVRAPLMIDRYDALAGMRAFPDEQKRAELIRAYGRESFHAIRSEVVTQLAADPHPDARALLLRAVNDKAAEVRLTVINSITGLREEEQTVLEPLLADSSYEVVAAALRKLGTRFPDACRAYCARTAGDHGVGEQIPVIRHELLAGLGDTASLDSLARLARPEREFRTRLNAFEALKRLNHCPEDVVHSLCDAMTHPNGRLRGPATECARHFLATTALRTLFQRELADAARPAWKREMLRAAIEGE
jgi:aminopeptidase N